MEYNGEKYDKLWELLKCRLKRHAEKIVFLQLKNDILSDSEVVLPKNVLLPFKSDQLVKGIRNGEFAETIGPDKFIPGMVAMVGCDDSFKYNGMYIDILKKVNNKAGNYLQCEASRLVKEGNYTDALIYFIALDKICDNHRVLRYNIASILKSMASDAGIKCMEEQAASYRELSFMELYRLSRSFPDYADVHIMLGHYYTEEKQYDQALSEFEAAYKYTSDDDVKKSIAEHMERVRDYMGFEQAREMIVGDQAMKGIKILIPIVEKYGTWSEARYYTALGYRKLHNYKKCEVLLSELIDSGAEIPGAYNELGLCYYSMGEYDRALESFKKAVAMEDDNPVFLCNLGLACYEMGQTSKACEYINSAYKIDPNDELTRKCKELLTLK